ncbi:PEP/pyruvate-binding domain-containing protein [Brachybacterium hainanense]|uniref:PEP/pyruvate-binding domain-containing protein n=1 Tax=Brachybacterium hainanense TaxID=1541174 RepID=A0ABV6RGK5_9MICO
MSVIDLTDIDPEQLDLVGGKAAGLARLIRCGERVPDGFCLTTAAHRAGAVPRQEVRTAYRALGTGTPVAVRSSATAEDLPFASFAGQQDTILDVRGEEALFAAIEECWRSLDSDRARAYRSAQGVGRASMAVVIQRMVAPQAAGVLFTADPLTGTRTRMVVDAAAGLGTAVVDGTEDTDHYVLAPDGPPPGPGGCLDAGQLAQLRAAGERIQEQLGGPQDVEWAFDAEGVLWMLQSRAVTSLFPLPDPHADPPRVYLEVGHMQGMLRPFTAIGGAVMERITRGWLEAFGVREGLGADLMVHIGGRMFLDLTGAVRSARLRGRLPEAMRIYGPRVSRAMEAVCEDPRFAPRRGGGVPLRDAARVALRTGVPMLRGIARTLRDPARETARCLDMIGTVRAASEMPEGERSVAENLRLADEIHRQVLSGPMMDSLGPLWTAMACQSLATALLRGLAEEPEVQAVMRGAPHNVTTQMDLALWDLADRARAHRSLLTTTPTAELAQRYRDGTLPDIGLDGFLARYGHRAAAEIDVGVPRWEEDPAPVLDAIAGYLLLEDPEQAPDRRFARAAEEAEAALAALVARMGERSPLRARAVAWLLGRARELIGLRELPKFLWLFPLRQLRRQHLAAGAELAAAEVIAAAGDVVHLTRAEIDQALADGGDLRDVVAQRAAVHARELRRRHVPGLLLSDGTDVEAALPAPPGAEGMAGMGAAPGTARGRARVITDPRGARIEPGEILVAPTTDPGWTPLFLTAAGLVTETGSPMAHGPTVAREYGIPAVICVREATSIIRDGQLLSIDGSAGLVRIEEDGV